MPASRSQQEDAGARLLPVLFWAGVGLAPLAALLLVLGPDGAARFAGALAVVAVVLIGLSIGLRQDVRGVREELAEILYDEIEVLRGDLRQDLTVAARAIHRQLGEKVQTLHETVDALRVQVEAPRYDRAETHQQGAGHAGPHPHVPVPGRPTGHASVGHPSGRADVGHGGHPYVGTAGVPPVMGGGVVRHTETVQVTTRHTIVDPAVDGTGVHGTVYGGTMYGRAADPGVGRHAGDWREPEPEPWTDQRPRDRHGGQRGPEPQLDDSREARRSWRYERDDDDPGDAPPGERWSGIRAGDRWASVRADDRGRELRMGERRAALHADESGTELRIEDRWASVRRDEPRRWDDEPRRWDAPERWSDDRWQDEPGDSGRWDERAGPAALPPGGGDSDWAHGWDVDRASTPGGRAGRRRYRDDDDDADDGYGWQSEWREPQPVRVRQRRGDYEASDDRWR
jgi:hypothetical protein